MATSTYIQISPITGESTDTDHVDWIEVEGYSIGEAQTTSDVSASGGAGASQAVFSPLSVTKLIDKSSPDLNQYCAAGTNIAKLELQVCQETGSKEWYVKIELENVFVKSDYQSGGGLSRPTESVEFVYGTIKWDNKPIGADGAAGGPVGPKGWSLAEGKAI